MQGKILYRQKYINDRAAEIADNIISSNDKRRYHIKAIVGNTISLLAQGVDNKTMGNSGEDFLGAFERAMITAVPLIVAYIDCLNKAPQQDLNELIDEILQYTEDIRRKARCLDENTAHC